MKENDHDARELFKRLRDLIEGWMGETGEPDFKIFINSRNYPFPFPVPRQRSRPRMSKEEIKRAKAEGLCDGCPSYNECHRIDVEGDLEIDCNDKDLVELIEGDNVITIIAEIPGVTREDFTFNVGDKVLYISACEWEKKVRLPCVVKDNDIGARYNNGILELTLKKK